MSQSRELLERLFEAEPLVHPYVLDAYEKAAALLRKHHIPFRVIGGLALSLQGAGRPTKDVDLVVSRENWHRAREVLQVLATDTLGIRFGLPDEPDNGLAFIGPHDVCIEVWPEGVTHQQIAKIRGKHRPHQAGKLAFTLKGEESVSLLNSKLASYLSASDRLRDAADVQSLISKLGLSLDFVCKLHPSVQRAYRRIWKGQL